MSYIVKDLTKDLGWDEDRKKIAHYLVQDIFDALADSQSEVITPQEIVKHWCVTYDTTDEEVKKEIRELYDALPRIELSAWERVNSPSKTLKRKAATQMGFVKSVIKKFVSEDIYVVGKHYVENIAMPVYRIKIADVEITFAGNFKGWEASVSASESDLEKFKATGEFKNSEMSFNGFPEDVKYKESIFENSHKFSIKMNNDYDLYTFVYNLNNHLSRRG